MTRRGTRPRPRRKAPGMPKWTSLVAVTFVTFGLSALLLLSSTTKMKIAVLSYMSLAIIGSAITYATHPNWLEFRGLMTVLNAVMVWGMVIGFGFLFSSIATSYSPEGHQYLPTTLSIFDLVINVGLKSALMAGLVAWSERSLIQGGFYGVLNPPYGERVRIPKKPPSFSRWMSEKGFKALITAVGFGLLHLVAYPDPILIFSPMLTMFFSLYLMEFEGGIIGGLLGHCLGDFTFFLMRGG